MALWLAKQHHGYDQAEDRRAEKRAAPSVQAMHEQHSAWSQCASEHAREGVHGVGLAHAGGRDMA
jgi:hypothetical protein